MLNYEFPPLGGGGGKQSMYLAREYAKKNDVYFLTAGYDTFGIVKKEGYTLHRLKTSRKSTLRCSIFEMLSFVNSVRKKIPEIVDKFKPEAIHVFFTLPTGLLVFHSKFKGIPYIVSVRGSDVPGHSPDRFKLIYKISKPIVIKIWKKAKKVVCNSEDLKKEVLGLCPNLDVEVISNGIDTEKFKPKKTKSDKTRLLYVGRVIPLKQIDLIIKGLTKLDKSVVLRIVGDGEQREELVILVNKLGLKDRVEFVGEVSYDEIEREYQKGDVYVQLSKVEGMSNTVLEAMSCGLPVITTNVGGVSSFVRDNGMILDDGEYWWKHFKKLDLEYMGKKSREIAERMGFEEMGKKYGELLNGV